MSDWWVKPHVEGLPPPESTIIPLLELERTYTSGETLVKASEINPAIKVVDYYKKNGIWFLHVEQGREQQEVALEVTSAHSQLKRVCYLALPGERFACVQRHVYVLMDE